jgi:hypothetical protein
VNNPARRAELSQNARARARSRLSHDTAIALIQSALADGAK